MKRSATTIVFATSLFLRSLTAQVSLPFVNNEIKYKEYMIMVKERNLAFAAEKLNVSIADARIKAAAVFNDPVLTVEYSEDRVAGTREGYGYYGEVLKTFDLTGKRKARIDLTRNERDLSHALLNDFYRNLQADATLLFLEGMKHQQLFNVIFDSYTAMKRLAEADSIRLRLGSIMEINAIQSKMEADILLNDLQNSLAEWKNSLAEIALMTGVFVHDTLPLPASNLFDCARNFSIDSLIKVALENRTDLQAALLDKKVSEKFLVLIRKERNAGVDMKVGYSNYNNQAGTPLVSSGIMAGFEVPIRFSNLNKGEIEAARLRVEQSETFYHQVELKIRKEIIQAWDKYLNFSKQVKLFKDGLLENSEQVRKGKTYSYLRGETSLLEVLNAQKTYNDIQTSYYLALFNQAAALVELERNAGIWDISF